jgi:hypothetical protein
MAQYDIVNNIACDEGLRKTKKGSKKDEEQAQHTLPPVPPDIRTQVLEVGLDAGIAFLADDSVLRHFPG